MKPAGRSADFPCRSSSRHEFGGGDGSIIATGQTALGGDPTEAPSFGLILHLPPFFFPALFSIRSFLRKCRRETRMMVGMESKPLATVLTLSPPLLPPPFFFFTIPPFLLTLM